jgi:hypothetical protein
MERVAIAYFSTHPNPAIRSNLCNQQGGGGGSSKADRPKFVYILSDKERSPGEKGYLTKGQQPIDRIQSLSENAYREIKKRWVKSKVPLKVGISGSIQARRNDYRDLHIYKKLESILKLDRENFNVIDMKLIEMTVLSLLTFDPDIREFLVNSTGGGEFIYEAVDKEYTLYVVFSNETKTLEQMRDLHRKSHTQVEEPDDDETLEDDEIDETDSDKFVLKFSKLKRIDYGRTFALPKIAARLKWQLKRTTLNEKRKLFF